MIPLCQILIVITIFVFMIIAAFTDPGIIPKKVKFNYITI